MYLDYLDIINKSHYDLIRILGTAHFFLLMQKCELDSEAVFRCKHEF